MTNQDMGRSGSLPSGRRAIGAPAIALLTTLLCMSSGASAQSAPATQPGALPMGIIVHLDGKLTMNYRDMSLQRILDDLTLAAGVSVVQTVKVQGTIASISSPPAGVSKQQAVAILNAAANPLGYQLTLENDIVKVGASTGRLMSAQKVTPRPSNLTAEQTMVLTGIIQADNGFAAILENVSSAAISRVQIGDSVANGKIADIQMDRIAYLNGSRTTWVPVGENLTGDSSPRKESRP